MKREAIEAEARRCIARLKRKEEWLTEELKRHAPEDRARIEAGMRFAWLHDAAEDLERIAVWLAEMDNP